MTTAVIVVRIEIDTDHPTLADPTVTDPFESFESVLDEYPRVDGHRLYWNVLDAQWET